MNRAIKICLIKNRLMQGYSDKEIMYEADIPRRTYYRWKYRIEAEGLDKVVKKKKTGPISSNLIDSGLRRKILQWRDRYEWGPSKIEGHLKAHLGLKVSHRQIYYLLCKEKRNHPITEPRRTWGRARFVREHSNSLWQADFKLLDNDYWMLTFIDDHARFIVGSNDNVWNPTTEEVIHLLERSVRRFGAPEQVLTDRGTQFWNNRSDKLSVFTQFCLEQGIDHIVASKRRPTTTGKIEAFHGCYDRERKLFINHEQFIRYWNYKRPNGGIEYLYPAEVYFIDRK